MHERASHAASRSGVGYSSRSPALLRSRLIAHARPPGRMSLFWRVFTANAALLVAAALVLGVSPVTVSWPIAVTEAVVLGLGLAGMLAANAVLLRLAFAPLTALADADDAGGSSRPAGPVGGPRARGDRRAG